MSLYYFYGIGKAEESSILVKATTPFAVGDTEGELWHIAMDSRNWQSGTSENVRSREERCEIQQWFGRLADFYLGTFLWALSTSHTLGKRIQNHGPSRIILKSLCVRPNWIWGGKRPLLLFCWIWGKSWSTHNNTRVLESCQPAPQPIPWPKWIFMQTELYLISL